MLRLGLVLAALSLAGSPAAAISFCSEPNVPYCAKQYGPFENQQDFEDCKSSMQRYKRELDDFLDCQKRESQEAIDEYNHTVERLDHRPKDW